MQNNKDIKNDDELLMRFFSEAKQEIKDEGFTEKVMQRLPQHAKRMNQIWTTVCFALGMAIFILFDGVEDLRILSSNIMSNIAGYLSSIDLTKFSPTLIIGSIAVLGIVWLYNILSIQR
ncbi:MAG: DUF5056 domain-containing protein [Prevotella sp.]|jgi:hypothetical protein